MYLYNKSPIRVALKRIKKILVAQNSVLCLCRSTPDEKLGIFKSKIHFSECPL